MQGLTNGIMVEIGLSMIVFVLGCILGLLVILFVKVTSPLLFCGGFEFYLEYLVLNHTLIFL